VDLNALSPSRIKAFGLDINNAADRTLLISRMNASGVIARGFTAPYASYALTNTLAQTLRPYPQFGSIPMRWAPLGNSWYDSLQAKLTKRYSSGLSLTAAFTWQKELVLGSEGGSVNDVFNRPLQKSFSPSSMPFVLVTGFTYRLPAVGPNRLVKALVRDWAFGGVLRYASGQPIAAPSAQNALSSLLFRGTYANRVPGQPLFLKDLNCHCIDPNKDFVLNPAAWSDPAAGQWGTAARYYNDYRSARRPDEELSLARTFRIHERVTFQIRAEFFNVFNRAYMVNPSSTNALQTPVRNSSGVPTSGFGYINSGALYGTNGGMRNGQLVGRIQW
jgi:hypothetical protein